MGLWGTNLIPFKLFPTSGKGIWDLPLLSHSHTNLHHAQTDLQAIGRYTIPMFLRYTYTQTYTQSGKYWYLRWLILLSFTYNLANKGTYVDVHIQFWYKEGRNTYQTDRPTKVHAVIVIDINTPTFTHSLWDSHIHTRTPYLSNTPTTNVTRLGDFLHFGQFFKAFGNNDFAQISHMLRQFL